VQNLRRQFVLGLRDLGDVEGRDFTMEDRNADGHLERLPALAADLARLIESAEGRARSQLHPERRDGKLWHAYWHCLIRARKPVDG